MAFWKTPERALNGVFCSPKSPRGHEPEFFGVNSNTFMFIASVSKFWKIHKDLMNG